MTSTREALEGVVARLAEVIDQLPADPPEVPDIIHEWPTADSHLRGEFWKCSWGSVISYRGDGWYWWNRRDRTWHRERTPGFWPPLTRTTDPSQPRRFDSLGEVPEDLERAVGKYLSYPCELARSPLSGTGWMMRVDHPYVRQQWVEYMGLDEDDLADIEEVIDHE